MIGNKKLPVMLLSCLFTAFAVAFTVSGRDLRSSSVSVYADTGCRVLNAAATTRPTENSPEESAGLEHSVIQSSTAETTRRNKTTETAPKTSVPTTRKTTVPTTGKKTGRTTTRVANAAATTAARFTVTFYSNGGTAVPSQTVRSEGKVKKPADPTRKGFKFSGWYKDAALTDDIDFATDRISGNAAAYAKWTSIASTVTYTITFKSAAGGGTITFSPAEALPGERIILAVVPEEGKRLKDGSLKINGVSTEKHYFTMPQKNVVITADFEDAPIEAEEESSIGRGLLILIFGLVLVCVTLAVIALSMREKPIGESAAEWNDPTIALSEYKDKPPQNNEGAVFTNDDDDDNGNTE